MTALRTWLRGELGALFAANFLLALHLYLVIYVTSNYLVQFIAERFVGAVYLLGAILSTASFFLIQPVLRRFGAYATLLALALLELLVFIGLAFPGRAPIALALFAAYLVLYPLILFTLDFFVERSTAAEGTTGGVRGAFLTVANVALLISPALAGLLLFDGRFARVFLVSALFLVPFIALMAWRFRRFEDGAYRDLRLYETLRCIKGNPGLAAIFKAHFIMRLFFGWMVIYLPLYLHDHIGFDWPQIGLMLSIVLIPYALLELPAGKIADSLIGEKEMLTLGFLLTGVSIAAVSVLGEADFLTWTALLLMTRVGAALIEITTETYFFRHVDAGDANTIGGFRILQPLSYVVSPALGTLALLFMDLRYFFIVMGVVILFGIRYALRISDSR